MKIIYAGISFRQNFVGKAQWRARSCLPREGLREMCYFVLQKKLLQLLDGEPVSLLAPKQAQGRSEHVILRL